MTQTTVAIVQQPPAPLDAHRAGVGPDAPTG